MAIIKLLLLFLIFLYVSARSMPNLALGRWSRGILPDNVDRYLKRRHPELQGSRATNVQSQVAGGTNYRVRYEGPVRADAEVSYQPWNNAFKERSYRRL